ICSNTIIIVDLLSPGFLEVCSKLRTRSSAQSYVSNSSNFQNNYIQQFNDVNLLDSLKCCRTHEVREFFSSSNTATEKVCVWGIRRVFLPQNNQHQRMLVSHI
ncbi:unnamed protein product, partial [Tenebrio molitor]